ncbi:Holliday junction branch migration protein RuvA [Candidatus Phytoplasma sacchari]|uniref:Holliday junction branch migration complex subunit RuvA n=1 Tax=Candidatus Phytoplasma sacchari TaxID=2609813 RepID=A0ABY7M1D7_9MOLU|nr:Holliday junction branch migration protein RuvA [Candidatus Phytoplasma sacchari]KAB8122653.1 Holliday junction branch migration protein RuvA [Candidatus Phytoplasma sacchari]WBL31532.1 Holliday junction branch migration protein RuvA [Candidatus Phytoplasma sacchari]
MYHYFKGIISDIQKDCIVLENNEIGYLIQFYKPEDFFVLNQKVKIFIYFHVRENINCLYGFLNPEMLSFFKKLINISGIGPKNALLMSNSDFLQKTKESLQNNDLSKLLEFPGIGKKIANQIIFHFKDKILFLENENIIAKKMKNTKEALVNLGFLNREIDSIINKLNFEDNLENIIKKALIYLNQKKQI